ncbi:MAG: NtaA/DmoA family FMN-dependent monooxygenase [Gordonia sp. (in: high G+C Gram-positive bacteria)]
MAGRSVDRRDGGLILAIFLMPTTWVQSRRNPHTAIPQILDTALRAEAAKFHAVFLPDSWELRRDWGPVGFQSLEPIGLLNYVAAHTDNIGLIATVSTTWSQPYNLARQFATLDLLSDGRAGWNIVTSVTGATNFGVQQPSHAERYRRAHEFVTVVDRLWDSWGAESIQFSEDGRAHVDAAHIHPIDHSAEHFTVAGPLNIPRTPQVRPLHVQAGASQHGIELAAQHAELVFTAQPFDDVAKNFRLTLHEAFRNTGRTCVPPRVLTGVRPIIAATRDEAEEKLRRQLDNQSAQHVLVRYESAIGRSLSEFPLDDVLPIDLVDAVDTDGWNGNQSFYEITRRHIASGITLRQLLTTDQHWRIVGSPGDIADRLSERFDNDATDGYNLIVNDPESFELFLGEVIPELQRRGLFRTDYSGRTFREDIAAAGRPPLW